MLLLPRGGQRAARWRGTRQVGKGTARRWSVGSGGRVADCIARTDMIAGGEAQYLDSDALSPPHLCPPADVGVPALNAFSVVVVRKLLDFGLLSPLRQAEKEAERRCETLTKGGLDTCDPAMSLCLISAFAAARVAFRSREEPCGHDAACNTAIALHCTHAPEARPPRVSRSTLHAPHRQ